MVDLSIIIPVFNGEKYLENAVSKLIKIKALSYEVVIINDHSVDNTYTIAEKLAQHENVSFHELPETAGGRTAAMNLGISVAKGKYIIFLDMTDIFFGQVLGAVQTAIELEVDVLHTPGHYVLVPDQLVHLDDGKQVTRVIEFDIGGDRATFMNGTSYELLDYFLKHEFHWTPCGKIYRREFLLEHDIRFPEDINIAEGMFFLLPCLINANKYALYCDTIYLHSDQETSFLEGKQPEEALKALLENEARGLKHMEDFFSELPSQELLSLAKARFCSQMDPVIASYSRNDPGIWEKVVQDGSPLFQNPWWVARHLAGWHQDSVYKQRLLEERQQQQVALAATEALLDETFKTPCIMVLASVYTMFLCILYRSDWDKSIFVCGGGMPSSIIHNLRKLGVQCYGEGDGKIFGNAGIMQCLARYATRNHIPILGNDDTPEATYFMEQDFIVMEDGNANYYPELMEKQKNVKRIAPSGEQYMPFGFSRFVKHVLLTGKHTIPDILKSKAKIIRIQELWDKKTEKEKDKILKLFNFPRKELEQQVRKGRDCLLIGSDNAGKGYCKEEQEIAMYRDMMAPYGEKRFIIKPHHQNKADLRKYFPDCYVMPKEFPIELIKLLKFKLHRVIGAESSALSNLFPTKIIEDRVDLMRKHGIPVPTDSQNTENDSNE